MLLESAHVGYRLDKGYLLDYFVRVLQGRALLFSWCNDTTAGRHCRANIQALPFTVFVVPNLESEVSKHGRLTRRHTCILAKTVIAELGHASLLKISRLSI